MSCAAGVAVAKAFKDEKILENVAARSKQLRGMLEKLWGEPEIGQHIHDVRGLGLMLAVEFKPGSSGSIGSKVQAKCKEKGMLILTTSVYDTLRFIPALNITETDMTEGCRILEESVREVIAEGQTPKETATKGQALE